MKPVYAAPLVLTSPGWVIVRQHLHLTYSGEWASTGDRTAAGGCAESPPSQSPALACPVTPSSSPSLAATATACARESTPSLLKRDVTWVFTVFSVTMSRCAISLLVRPSATRRSTSSSRLLRRVC